MGGKFLLHPLEELSTFELLQHCTLTQWYKKTILCISFLHHSFWFDKKF